MLNPRGGANDSVSFVQYKRPGVKNLAASDGRQSIASNIIVQAAFLMSCLIPSLSSTSCVVRVKSETPSRSSLWTPVDTLWSNEPSRSLCKYKSLLLANEKNHSSYLCIVCCLSVFKHLCVLFSFCAKQPPWMSHAGPLNVKMCTCGSSAVISSERFNRQYSAVSRNAPEFLMWHGSDTQGNTATPSKLGVGYFLVNGTFGETYASQQFCGAHCCFRRRLQWCWSVHFLITVLSIIAHNFRKDLQDATNFPLHPPSVCSWKTLSFPLHTLSLSSHPLPLARSIFSMWSVMALAVSCFLMCEKTKQNQKENRLQGLILQKLL